LAENIIIYFSTRQSSRLKYGTYYLGAKLTDNLPYQKLSDQLLGRNCNNTAQILWFVNLGAWFTTQSLPAHEGNSYPKIHRNPSK
jgi:hypothetical protein